jgi:hypothetical protein
MRFRRGDDIEEHRGGIFPAGTIHHAFGTCRRGFANQEKALGWLHTPNQSLAGRTPLEAAATEDGFQEADDVLTRIESGVLG